jgi:lipoprotein-releasing system permease protein
MSGRLGVIAELAFKHLSRRRRQTIVAVLGVAVGVGFFLAVSALMVGSQNDFVKTLIDAAPHVIVYDELRSPLPQPAMQLYGKDGAVEIRHQKVRTEVRGIRAWQAIVASVDAVPGAFASPSLSGGVTLRLGGREEAVGLIGFDPEIEAKVSNIEENLKEGHLRDLQRVQGGMLIGEELARRMGLGMGDVVNATSIAGTRTLRVVGLVKRGNTALGGGSIYVLLREAQSLLGRPFIVNRIGIRIADPYQAEAVAGSLERRYSYKFESWQERSTDFLSLLLTRNIIMYSVVSAILLVASFGIYTAISTSVSDKVRDIAILRAIGFSQGDLQLLFVLEGIVLAALGILVGWALGYGLMNILGSIPLSVNGVTENIPLDRTPRQYAIAAAASFATGVIAAWLPARKAARVDPVDILRGAT